MESTTIIFVTDRLIQFYNLDELKKLYNLEFVLVTDCDYKHDTLKVYKIKSSVNDFLPKLFYDDVEYLIQQQIEKNASCKIICNDDVNFAGVEKIKRKFHLNTIVVHACKLLFLNRVSKKITSHYCSLKEFRLF